jgi:hypothetical protein
MKFSELRSIGHNIADSLGSGIGLLIGVYEIDVYGEVRRSPGGAITVDFLAGKCIDAAVSPYFADAVARYRDGLTDLCAKHGVPASSFRELTARYSVDRQAGWFITVTVSDHHGHHSIDEYVGTPARRIQVLDRLGRIRPK